MSTQSEEYATQSREFFENATQSLQEGDLDQASEKLCGAAALMVKSVAEERGWPHGGHPELYRTVSRFAQKSGESGISVLFQVFDSHHNQLLRKLDVQIRWGTRLAKCPRAP